MKHMKMRADLILATVTMIVAGIAFAVSGRTAAVICAMIGGAIVLIVHLIPREKQRPRS